METQMMDTLLDAALVLEQMGRAGKAATAMAQKHQNNEEMRALVSAVAQAGLLVLSAGNLIYKQCLEEMGMTREELQEFGELLKKGKI